MSSFRMYNKYYKSDIFNTSSKIEYFSPRRKNLQSSLQKTSYDIFNSDKSNHSLNNNDESTNKHSKKYINKSQSDIFNVKTEIKKIKTRNNPNTDSHIFLGNNYTDYIVKKPKKKEEFNPKYSINTSLGTYCKQFFNKENKNKNFTSSKGYLDNEIKLNNHHILQNPIRRKIKWTNESSSNININPSNTSRINKINAQISNIFNLPDKDYSKIELTRKNEEEKLKEKNKLEKNNEKKKKAFRNNSAKDIKNYDKYEFGSIHSKWKQSKIDWMKPETSIMFQKFNDKENSKLNAFQRKQNEINGNINYNNKKDIKINVNDNIPKFKKIKRLIDLNSPLMNEPKKKKIMQNVSTNNLFENDYYDKILTKKKLNILNESEYSFRDNSKSRNDESTLRRIFSNEGIHIYDINSHYDKIFGDANDYEITFKIRNDDENEIKRVTEKLLKEKNIHIEPKKKIVVNRKKNKISNQKNGNYIENIKLNNNLSNPKFSKNKFTNQFIQINNNYKNNSRLKK